MQFRGECEEWRKEGKRDQRGHVYCRWHKWVLPKMHAWPLLHTGSQLWAYIVHPYLKFHCLVCATHYVRNFSPNQFQTQRSHELTHSSSTSHVSRANLNAKRLISKFTTTSWCWASTAQIEHHWKESLQQLVLTLWMTCEHSCQLPQLKY